MMGLANNTPHTTIELAMMNGLPERMAAQLIAMQMITRNAIRIKILWFSMID